MRKLSTNVSPSFQHGIVLKVRVIEDTPTPDAAPLGDLDFGKIGFTVPNVADWHEEPEDEGAE